MSVRKIVVSIPIKNKNIFTVYLTYFYDLMAVDFAQKFYGYYSGSGASEAIKKKNMYGLHWGQV